jgi:TonB family protein
MQRDTSRTLPKLALLVLIGMSVSTSLPAQRMISSRSDRPIDGAIQMNHVLYQVPPEYPFEARRSRITGEGILVGQVDSKTGNVTSVRMEKSTGNTILDQAALNAFRQWRFKPGTTRKFRTPIIYEMVGSRAEAMERIRRLRATGAR